MGRVMRQLVCLLCVFTFVLAITGIKLGAADEPVIFMVFENNIVRDKTATPRIAQDTMPFVEDGYVYVYYGHFSYFNNLTAFYNSRLQQAVVFNLNQKLFFDMSNNQTYDDAGNMYTSLAKWHNGKVYLPARTVCERFDMYYSYVPGASPAPVLRIEIDQSPMADSLFLEGHSRFLRELYDEYQNSFIPTPTEPNETTAPPVTTVPPRQPAKLVYVAYFGPINEYTQNVLDALDSVGRKAAFFITPDSILQHAGLVRQIYAQGHTLGLYISGFNGPEDLETLIKDGNNTLRDAVMTKARLVCLEGGSEAAGQQCRDTVINLGLRMWDATVFAPTDVTKVSTLTSRLNTALDNATKTSVVAVRPTKLEVDTLPGVLAHIRDGNFSYLTIKDWDTPLNSAIDVR